MNFFFVKMLLMLLILFLLSIPFLPWKITGLTLFAKRYEKKNSWKNVVFVLETLVVGGVLLCFAPLLKTFFKWLFELEFMAWLVSKLSGRTVYAVDAIVVLALNFVLAFAFVMIKNLLRSILDRFVFKNTDSEAGDKQNKKSKKQKRKDKNRARYQAQSAEKDRKDLKKLRRESILVFGKAAKDKNVEKVDPAEFKTAKEKPVKRKKTPATDDMSFMQLVRYLWFSFIGVFYDEEEDYAYVKVGTYRWAKQLRLFGLLFGAGYVVLCLLVQIPIFFPTEKDSFVYSAGAWFLNNAYICPTIALVLICELFWFLGGEYKSAETAEAPFVSFVSQLRESEEVSAEQAKNAIMEKYGTNYKIRYFESEPMEGSSTYHLSEKKKSIQNLASAIRASKGFVNNDYMQSVEYMLDGKHVLFDSVLYSELGDYILNYLLVTLSFGKRVLFICKDQKDVENISEFLTAGFSKLTKSSRVLWRICTYEQLHEGQRADVLLLTPEQFLEPTLFTDGKDFFDELVDVFVSDVDKILTANNYYCLIMVKKLEKATTDPEILENPDADRSLAVKKKVRYRFFSSGHIQSLENSIRQFFNLEDEPLEVFHSFGLVSKTGVFVWHTGITSALYVDNGANQVPLEVQIAKDAATLGISDINLITDSAIYSSQRNEISGLKLNNPSLTDSPLGYVIVADDCFNLPNAIYNFSRFSGKKTAILHVVSKPYLLREYFTSQAEKYLDHFELIGKTMSEHAEIRRANIIILLSDAINGIEREEFLRRASSLLSDGSEAGAELDLDQCVRLCYRTAFGEDRDYEPQYSLKQEQNSELQTKTFVYIKDSEKLFENLLEHTKTVKLEYINTQSVEYLPVFRNQITQHFIPGQILVRNNRVYTIKDMSVEDGVVVLDDTVPSVGVPMDYVQTRYYTVNTAEQVHSFGHDYRAKNSMVDHVDFRVYDADITVDTLGYYSIEKALQSVDLAKPNFAKYINLQNSETIREAVKRQIQTRMLVVELNTAEAVEDSAGYLLAVMLQEFMKTVFPHQYRCISVCYLFDNAEAEEAFFAEETAVRDLYSRLGGFSVDANQAEGERSTGGKLRFAIIEDVQGGNGVVETLIDGAGIMVTNLLHIAADFLSWLRTPAGQDYRYLNFGYDAPPAIFDFKGLEKAISQFRHQVERSELVRVGDGNTCFFCHKPLEHSAGETLEDGRTICNSCKENSVSTYEELDQLFTSVLETIKNSTTAADTFPTPIRIDFVSTRELRERYGEEDKLPLAYCDRMKGQIYVEYGLPKCSICSAVARIVTELWQDQNVDDDGSALFRAHPDYVAIQTLTALHFDVEAEALNAYLAGNAGLGALREALDQAGHKDSFAYFLDESGKKDRDVPMGEEFENDVFISERNPENLVKMYYNTLNEDEKAVYDQIYQAVSSYAERTGSLVREITAERCLEVMNAVMRDNAEIFWCSSGMGSVMHNTAGVAVDVIFKYIMTPAEAKRRKKQIEKAIKPFLNGIKPSMSDYEAALRTYENIVNIIDYDSIGLKEQEMDPNRHEKPDNLRSIYGVFVENKAVCAGYAKAFQYIVNRLGIECAYVIGPCKDGEWHAWNLIKLEGEYYYIDVTWGDRSNTDQERKQNEYVEFDYFCITTEELLRSRGIQKAEQFPTCTATACNYFQRSKLYFEAYDAERIRKVILSGLKAEKKHFSFKAKDAAMLSLLTDRLINQRGIFDMMNYAGDGQKRENCGSYCNKELNVLHIVIR